MSANTCTVLGLSPRVRPSAPSCIEENDFSSKNKTRLYTSTSRVSKYNPEYRNPNMKTGVNLLVQIHWTT